MPASSCFWDIMKILPFVSYAGCDQIDMCCVTFQSRKPYFISWLQGLLQLRGCPFLPFSFPNWRRPELLASHKLRVLWGILRGSFLLSASGFLFVMDYWGITSQLWDLPSLCPVIIDTWQLVTVYRSFFLFLLYLYWNFISHALALQGFLFIIPELLQQLQVSSHSCVFAIIFLL